MSEGIFTIVHPGDPVEGPIVRWWSCRHLDVDPIRDLVGGIPEYIRDRWRCRDCGWLGFDSAMFERDRDGFACGCHGTGGDALDAHRRDETDRAIVSFECPGHGRGRAAAAAHGRDLREVREHNAAEERRVEEAKRRIGRTRYVFGPRGEMVEHVAKATEGELEPRLRTFVCAEAPAAAAIVRVRQGHCALPRPRRRGGVGEYTGIVP